ncbi:hypothetical protein AK812_SmicGene1264 [Symbiodinium microadriaticum]|uniref:HECT domain-containing protein n=1 Tax=Symbiodinium microadriaticum TaxID=2951 RepID=A0A1Q9F4Q1_SYMMI|nr:hypothetical protein AK812_SmicGene1264 [Symbiodinium microadriaticum]
MSVRENWKELIHRPRRVSVQFVGEDGVDMGGVRKEFMDCFAEALTREEVTSDLTERSDGREETGSVKQISDL